MENLGKQTRETQATITNRLKEREEISSGVNEMIP